MSVVETAVGILVPEAIQKARKVLGPNEFRLLEKELQKITERTCKEYSKTYPHSAVAANPEGVWRTVVQCLELNKSITYDELAYGDRRVEDEDRQRFLKLLVFELGHNGAWFMRHNAAIQSQLAAAHDAKNDAQHQEMLALLHRIDELLSEGAWARAMQNAHWLHWNSAYLRHDHDFVGHNPEDKSDIVYQTCENIISAYPFTSGFVYCVAGEGGIGKTEVCREVLARVLILAPALKALYIDATDVKTVRDLAVKIHTALCHGAEAMNEDILPYLAQEAIEGGLLLYLDNFEDLIWGPESKTAWRWMEQLSRSDNCAVLLSSREKPVHLPGETIACLAPEAALELYSREYQRGNQGRKVLTPKEEAQVRLFLEKELEGHPLSIVMMAGQTCFFSVEESLQRWQELKSIDPPGDMERKCLYHSTLLTYNAMREKGWQDAINLWALHTALRTRATLHTYRIAGTPPTTRERLMRLGVLRKEDDAYRILNPLQEFMRQHYPLQEPEQWQQLLSEALRAYTAEQNTIANDGSMDERLRQMHEEYEHLISVWEAYWQGKKEPDELLTELFDTFVNDCRIYTPSLFGKVVERYVNVKDKELCARSLKCLGDLHKRDDDLKAAGEAYVKAERLYREIGARLGLANVLSSLGDLRLREADLKAAGEAYVEAERLYREIGARRGLANVLSSLGDLHLREADLKAADDAYVEAERLYREIGDRLGLANVLSSLGDLHVREADLKAAGEAYVEAERLYREIGDRLGLANVLKSLGDLHRREADLKAAGEAYVEAERLYREIGDRLGLANVLKGLGDLHLREADLKAAGEAYAEAEKLCREIGDRLGLANVLISLGDLHMREADLKAAGESYIEAEKLYREIGSRLGLANVLKSHGDLHRREDDLKAAGEAYAEAERLYREIGDRLGMVNVLCAYALTNVISDNLTALREVLQEAIALVPQAYENYLELKLTELEKVSENPDIHLAIAQAKEALKEKKH